MQAQILDEAGDKPQGEGKVVGAVQWVMSTLGEDQLPFKATAAMFGCIPDYREPSPGLDSTVLTEFEGSAMESDVLSAGDLDRILTGQTLSLHTCRQLKQIWKQMCRQNRQLEYMEVGSGRQVK